MKRKNSWFLLLLILCFLISLPAVYYKVQTENSNKTVEFSIDYESLLKLSNQSRDPAHTLDVMLQELKKEKVTSITLPNNSLKHLEERGLISVLTGDEAGAVSFLSDGKFSLDTNLSYVVILDKTRDDEIKELLTSRFAQQHIEVLSWKNATLIGIDIPFKKLLDASIPYLKSDVNYLVENHGFSLVVKMDNKWEGNENVAVSQLNSWKKEHISKIYFADSGVLGLPNTHKKWMIELPDVDYSYKEYFTKEEKQKGINELAKEKEYHIVRLHVISNELLKENLKSPEKVINRIILAANERNIRTFHIQFPTEADDANGEELFNISLNIVKKSITSLENEGFDSGISHSATESNSFLLLLSRLFGALSGVLVITWVIHRILPKYSLFSFILLTGLMISKPIVGQLSWSILGLLAAIFVPVASCIFLHDKISNKKNVTLLYSGCLFVVTSLLSMSGSLIIVAMFSETEYFLYLSQFRGVSFAHTVPLLLLLFCMFLIHNQKTLSFLLKLGNEPVRLYQIALIMIVSVVGVYYLSRTGNGGSLLPFEGEFRRFIEDIFGIRPRTKEFLFAHPLLIVIIFYWKKAKFVKWLLPLALIGQISLINSFTHFHTPVFVSFLRGLYGMGLGLLIGLLFIFIIEFLRKIVTKEKNR